MTTFRNNESFLNQEEQEGRDEKGTKMLYVYYVVPTKLCVYIYHGEKERFLFRFVQSPPSKEAYEIVEEVGNHH